MGGCAATGGSHPGSVAASSPMQMAGDRCHGEQCLCRAVDMVNRGGPSNEQAVAEGQKRFEIRTGRGLDPMEITINGKGTLKKPAERPDGVCGYVDLPPGKHRVHVHARASSEDAGMVPALWINEWGARTHDWYDTFQFKCGGNEPCNKDHLAQWGESEGKRPRGIFDPCGSVRVENLHWDLSHSPDVKVQELDLDFVLEVYKFEPRFPHAAKTCKGLGESEEAAQ
jgi:hypothetical protein